MDLLLSEAQPIPSHALIALFAIVLGGAQFLMTKGTMAHRWLGRIWVSAMLYVAISSFFIHELKVWVNRQGCLACQAQDPGEECPTGE